MLNAANVTIGCRVHHRREDTLQGYVVQVDDAVDDIATCRVVWGAASLADAWATPHEDQDVQWSNKLVVISH